MLDFRQGVVRGQICQTLEIPKNSNVCSHHVENHFANASTKPSLIDRLGEIIQKIKDPAFKEFPEEKQDAIFSDIDEIIKLVDPKEKLDKEASNHLENPNENTEEELHRRRIEEDAQEDELDENDIKSKSTLKPVNQDKIDAMIIEAQQLRKDIEAMP